MTQPVPVPSTWQQAHQMLVKEAHKEVRKEVIKLTKKAVYDKLELTEEQRAQCDVLWKFRNVLPNIDDGDPQSNIEGVQFIADFMSASHKKTAERKASARDTAVAQKLFEVSQQLQGGLETETETET